jgi:NAD(P)H dehydrogenase (quinone)
MKKILITGATGQLGKEVVNALLKKTDAGNVSVLVRDAAKAEDLKAKGVDIRIGNYDDEASLVKAFKGIDSLYFVSSSELANRSQQHENVVKAAKEAQVKHVVYTSFQRRNETASSPIAAVSAGHLAAEEALKKSGMAYTILKHGLYLDMLPIFLGEKILENGQIYQPAGEGKTAYILRKDLAEAGAAILNGTGHENKIYEAYAGKTYSYPEIAKIVETISGREISYTSPTPEEYIQTLTTAGVPMEFAGMFAGFGEAIKQGEFADTSHFMEDILGRKPVTAEEYLKEVYKAS